ncbi:hypothetical protein ACFLUF_03495 [Chloroflexota bacterium]
MAGVATRNAKTDPNLAPFWWRLTATGREPMQQIGRAVPTRVEEWLYSFLTEVLLKPPRRNKLVD